MSHDDDKGYQLTNLRLNSFFQSAPIHRTKRRKFFNIDIYISIYEISQPVENLRYLTAFWDSMPSLSRLNQSNSTRVSLKKFKNRKFKRNYNLISLTLLWKRDELISFSRIFAPLLKSLRSSVILLISKSIESSFFWRFILGEKAKEKIEGERHCFE